MRDLIVGDIVSIVDGSYVFGIRKGEYSEQCGFCNGDRNGLRVVALGINVMSWGPDGCRTGRPSRLCNTLVTDGHGSFWFAPDRGLRLSNPPQMVTINGKLWSEDTIAEALRKHAT